MQSMRSENYGIGEQVAELEDFEMKKDREWDRAFRVGDGGSFIFTMMHRGVIYASCGDHYVYALDALTGKEIWKFRTNDCNYGSPSTDGEFIFIPSYDTHLYAVDKRTGKEEWRFKTGGKLFSTPGVEGGTVFFGSEDDCLYALSAKSGKLLWRFRTGGHIASTPTIYNGRVLFGSCDHNIYCLDAGTGRELWRFTTGDDLQINKEIPIEGGRLYFAGLDNYLYCLEVETGKEIWRFNTGKYGNVSTPSIHRGRLYHPTRDGILYALTMEGKEIWRFRTGGFIAKSLVHEGVVYLGSEDRNFYALDAETGKERWRFETGGEIYDEAKIIGNLVCFGGCDCKYYGVDMTTGEEVWRFQSSSQQMASLPSIQSEYRLEIKKSVESGESSTSSGEKYGPGREERVSITDYHMTSEYSTTSEYRQKSDYDVDFVMFEDVLDFEGLKTRDIATVHLSAPVNL